MAAHQNIPHPTLDAIMEVDKWASAKTLELYRQDKKC
jgi:hypothetical protein